MVITHHAPTARSVGLHFQGHPLNAGFASNLEHIIRRYQPALWIHGHMHDAVDLQIGATRVLCNPAGYEAEKNTTRGYDPSLCVEITASTIRRHQQGRDMMSDTEIRDEKPTPAPIALLDTDEAKAQIDTPLARDEQDRPG